MLRCRWHDRKEGGGFLGAMGSHMIDLLSFVTNQRIAQVNAQLLTIFPEKKDAKTGIPTFSCSFLHPLLIPFLPLAGVKGAMRKVTSDDTCNLRLQLTVCAFLLLCGCFVIVIVIPDHPSL
jgi:predicted dehydrogenase